MGVWSEKKTAPIGAVGMPKVGIEPTLPKEHDFESCASASSATSACAYSISKVEWMVKKTAGNSFVAIHNIFQQKSYCPLAGRESAE